MQLLPSANTAQNLKKIYFLTLDVALARLKPIRQSSIFIVISKVCVEFQRFAKMATRGNFPYYIAHGLLHNYSASTGRI